MMKVFSLKVVMLLVSLFMAGCEMFTAKPDNVSGIDLSGAAYLGIDGSVISTDKNTNNLVKITDAHDLSSSATAAFLDNEGNFLGNDVIYADAWTFHPASDMYTIIAGEFIFKQTGEEKRHFGLLLNNQSGEIFGLEEYYFPEPYYGLQGPHYYQTDKEGNIYYVNPTDAHLYRILVNEGNNIQLERYMDGAAGINDQRYLVDKQGNVYFQDGGRVKKNTGGIEETQMRIVAFNGTDGNCYGFRQEWPDNVHMLLLKVEEEEFVSTKINDTGFWFEVGTGNAYQYFDYINNRSVIMVDGYFVPDRDFGNKRLIGIVFDEKSYRLTPIVTTEEANGEKIGPEGEYFWIRKSDVRFEALKLSSVQIDSINNVAHIAESVAIDIPSEFDITSALIDQGGIGINIKGFDLATETKYAGKITVKNGLQYYEESTVPFITNLSPIH